MISPEFLEQNSEAYLNTGPSVSATCCQILLKEWSRGGKKEKIYSSSMFFFSFGMLTLNTEKLTPAQKKVYATELRLYLLYI